VQSASHNLWGWKLKEVESNLHIVYLGLGSNIAPEANIPRSLSLLQQHVQLQALSSFWESPPVGSSGPNFLNAVALIHTDLDEDELRDQILKKIETQLGRIRTQDPNAPRTIDLDILIFDDQIKDDQIWERAYLALPLSELIQTLSNPQSGETLDQIACRLARETSMKRRRIDFPKTS
jgi:2-amino-4-hydroxy-6-hydroxymethyldihydropteridine diphosphokinase